MWIANLLEKTLMLGKTEDKRRRGRQRMRWLDSITDAMDMNLSKFQKILKDRGTWCAAVHGTWLSKWTTTKCSKCWPRLWGLSNEQSPCPHGAYILVQFNHPVMSSSLQTHGLQHSRLPCPSPTLGAYSNSCPLSWWCHPTISSSVVPFSSHLQSFQASGSFLVSQFFASGGQSIGA